MDSGAESKLDSQLVNLNTTPVGVTGWDLASWTNRQVVRAIYERANARFDLAHFDVMDV